MNEGALRGLRVAVVVMGVLIVVGVIGLIAALGYRAAGRSVAGGAAGVVPGAVVALPELVLEEPTGTRLTGVSQGVDRLTLLLQGGGPDRAVVVEARTGRVVQRVRLAQ